MARIDHKSPPDAAVPLTIDFDNNLLLSELFGTHGVHLTRIEDALGIGITARGNRLTLSGAPDMCTRARDILRGLYAKLENGTKIDGGDVDGVIRLSASRSSKRAPHTPKDAKSEIYEAHIRTPKRMIAARSLTQNDYIDALDNYELTLGIGPAGTGKTYLAVAQAAKMLANGDVSRVILSRPAVEAGERLGFLPGDMREKIDPYLRPLYDALYDMLPGGQVARALDSGEIEIAPLAFMRGRTLSNAFIILDEAQNATPTQMKMFLTRLGENSRMVITGDPTQVDLPPQTHGGRVASGLAEALTILPHVSGVKIIRFKARDVVRHGLVTRIVKAYEKHTNEPSL